MKNIRRSFGVLAIAAVCFFMLACPSPDDPGTKSPEPDQGELRGTLTIRQGDGVGTAITDTSNVPTGTRLVASYSGSESGPFTYKWYRDGTEIKYDGLSWSSNYYRAVASGRYRVSISASGYTNTISSNEVTVVAPPGVPETLDVGIYVNDVPLEPNRTYEPGAVLRARVADYYNINPTYQWLSGTNQVSTASSFTTPAGDADYTAVVNAAGYAEYRSAVIQVRTPAPPPAPALPGTLKVTRDGTVLVPPSMDNGFASADVDLGDTLVATYTGTTPGVTFEWWGVTYSGAVSGNITSPNAKKLGTGAEFVVPPFEEIPAIWNVVVGGRLLFVKAIRDGQELVLGPFQHSYIAPANMDFPDGTLTVYVNQDTVLEPGTNAHVGDVLHATWTVPGAGNEDFAARVVYQWFWRATNADTWTFVGSSYFEPGNIENPVGFLKLTQAGQYTLDLRRQGFNTRPGLRQITVDNAPPPELAGTLVLLYTRSGVTKTVVPSGNPTGSGPDMVWGTSLRIGDKLEVSIEGWTSEQLATLTYELHAAPARRGNDLGTFPDSLTPNPWNKVGYITFPYTIPGRDEANVWDQGQSGFFTNVWRGRAYKIVVRDSNGAELGAPSLMNEPMGNYFLMLAEGQNSPSDTATP